MENMAAIIQQLSGNPLQTPIGEKIQQATDPTLPTEDWNLNMLICDMINDTDEGPKDAVRAIRRLLQQNAGKNHQAVMYTLTVLETCVKNCGRRFHLLVTNKDFVQELVKLIGPKNDPPLVLQTKVLSIIQTWADAFRSQPDLSGVVAVYNDLRSKSIEFPEKSYDCQVPIHTPQRSVPVQPPTNHQPLSLYQQAVGLNPSHHQFQPFNPHANTAAHRMAAAGPIVLNEEQLVKLKSEIEIVNGNIRVFDEMLTELDKSNNWRAEDLELLHELNATCLQMQKRIVDLLDKISNEEVTSELLTVNDNLNTLFTRYEPYSPRNNNAAQPPPPQQRPNNSNLAIAAIPSPASVKPKTNPEASLIDLGESRDGGQLANQLEGLALGGNQAANKQLMSVDSKDQLRARPQPVAAAAAAAASGDSDFDEFAQLRSEKRVIDGVEVPNEQEVSEMESWLKEQNSSEPPASLSNTEFDKFLEQRFSNLERNQPAKKPTDSKTSEDLLDL